MKGLRYVGGALLAVLWTAPLSAQGPGGVIRGRVMDGATQQPLSGVTVTFGRRGALSLPDGRSRRVFLIEFPLDFTPIKP